MKSASGRQGRFVLNNLRTAARSVRFQGHELELFIGEGFLTVPFTIKGSDEAIKEFFRFLKQT